MRALEKGFLLHIGLPKTGTATLRRTLFAHHPEICFFGKSLGSKIPQGCQSQEIYKFLNPLIWHPWRSLDIEKHKVILRERILPGIEPGKFIIGSWEGLGGQSVNSHVERIKRLHSIFGSCRIMMTIRNPLTQTPSQYLQDIKGHFIRQNRPWMGGQPYIDIDEWLKRKIAKRKSLDNLFTYSRNIQTAVNLLGKENVGVFVFEELLDNPDQYYAAICNFIGIDVTQGLELTQQKHLQQRITQGQVEYLQRLSKSLSWGKLLLKIKGQKYRRRIFKANAGDGIPAKVSLPPQWEKEISDVTRAGNRWITENYHLPLSKYNYPL